jgi:tellurite resistance protein TerC
LSGIANSVSFNRFSGRDSRIFIHGRGGIVTRQTVLLWALFNAFVIAMLVLDLKVLRRDARAVSIREALTWSIVWIALAMIFCSGIYLAWGEEKAFEFLAGYLIEKSLSVDNLFVFLVIFSYFSVPAEYQHRVLFWGILGALVMRAIFIAAGAALLTQFHWMIYVFGGFLIYTGAKLMMAGDEKIDPEKNIALRLVRRIIPVTDEYQGQRFFIRRDGRLWATPLLLVLVVIESTDLIFAVDSIPAIFAITRDTFIVYTSNVFAILGLRALYFLLAGVMDMFRFLKVGLSFVLCFVGAKMLLIDVYKIPIEASLAVVASILAVSVFASLLYPMPAEVPVGVPPVKFVPATERFRRQVLWVWIILIASSLLLVKLTSIPAGPSAHEAIVTIRMAQRVLYDTMKTAPAEKKFDDAEAALESALEALDQRRYQEAILGAQKTLELVRR